VSLSEKKRRRDRRKRQKAIKKTIKQDIRRHKFSDLNNVIRKLKAENSAIQSTCETANENLNILRNKYDKLKHELSNVKSDKLAVKSKLVKSIRADQLSSVKDQNDNDIILGKGKFGICKLMNAEISGETVIVAVKQYYKAVLKEIVIEEAFLLTRLSHIAFPFVFGVALVDSCYMLVLEFCAVSEGHKHSLTIHKSLLSPTVVISELSWLLILMKCCEGFDYLHTIGIVHNDIKTDNILVMQSKCGSWYPKIIDFNKAVRTELCRKREIPAGDRAKYKSLYKHIDPAIYDGLYAPCIASDVYSF
jgi:archaellum component FlaC